MTFARGLISPRVTGGDTYRKFDGSDAHDGGSSRCIEMEIRLAGPDARVFAEPQHVFGTVFLLDVNYTLKRDNARFSKNFCFWSNLKAVIDEDQLDLQSAALELGVHYQTAYRWVRSGRLPAEVIDSRYIVSRAALAEAAAARFAPKAPAPPSKRRVERQANEILRCLHDGDEAGARSACTKLLNDGLDAIDLIEQVISPALREIGRSWHEGEIDIWVEHRASAIVERVLGDASPNPRGRRRGTAVVAAVAGDRHGLPTTMATLALRGANWNVHQLGADTPADTLLSFLDSNAADLVVVSNTNTAVVDRVDEVVEAIELRGVPVLKGAPGLTLRQLVADAAAVTAERRSA